MLHLMVTFQGCGALYQGLYFYTHKWNKYILGTHWGWDVLLYCFRTAELHFLFVTLAG